MVDDYVGSIAEKYRTSRGGLISILDEIQTREGYLPEPALRRVADLTGRTLVDVYGVATFYKAFRLTPRGKHLVSVCVGTACHVRGAAAVVDQVERHLGINGDGGTTSDREFTVECVRCVGACALGPILVIDGDYSANVEPEEAVRLIEARRLGLEAVPLADDERVFPSRSTARAATTRSWTPGPGGRASVDPLHGVLRPGARLGAAVLALRQLHHGAGGEIPADTVVNFFCPHCHGDLMGGLELHGVRCAHGARDGSGRRHGADLLAAGLPQPHAGSGGGRVITTPPSPAMRGSDHARARTTRLAAAFRELQRTIIVREHDWHVPRIVIPAGTCGQASGRTT
jgi:NADH-quinone oxidoreductase subunit E